MKVKDLKKLIANLPDDTLVVTSAFDHKYSNVTGGVVKARISRDFIQEHYEGGHGFAADEVMAGERVINVLLIN